MPRSIHMPPSLWHAPHEPFTHDDLDCNRTMDCCLKNAHGGGGTTPVPAHRGPKPNSGP